MSLLPRKEKKICHLGKFGAPQMFSWMFFFFGLMQTTCVKRVTLTFAANLQRLTTCGSLIHKTHPLIGERPTLQNTGQLSSSRQVWSALEIYGPNSHV